MQNKRVLFGLSTFIIGGIAGIVSMMLRGMDLFPNPDIINDWSLVVQSNQYLISQYLYIILAYTLPFFGFWSLYEILRNKKQLEKLSFWGMIFSIIGTALVLPNLGVFAYVSPQVGKWFIEGNDVSNVIVDAISKTAMPVGIFGAILYTIGPTLLGIAIWKSKIFSKLGGILLILHGLILSFSFSLYYLLFAGWVLLIIVGIMTIINYRQNS